MIAFTSFMFFLCFEFYYFCGYNDSSVRIRYGPRTLAAAKAKCDVLNESFRLKFDFSAIAKIDEDSYDYAVGTFKNVGIFLGRLIKCARFRPDYDMIVKVSAIQGGSALAIGSSYADTANPCFRPVQASIQLKESSIPFADPSNWDTPLSSQNHFWLYVHEMFHALGIGQQLMQAWINKTTGEMLGRDTFRTSIPYKGKTVTIVHSENAHEYAVRRWGKEKFFDGKVPAGIEMQDMTYGYEDLNHPAARIYKPDIMLSVDYRKQMFTQVSLALLKDTGWWDVNWSMATMNPWGEASLLGDEPYQGFPDGVQTRDWPEHIQYKDNGNVNYCDPLYAGSGYVNRVKVDCSNPGIYGGYCAKKGFVDPDGYGAVDDALADYIGYIDNPIKVCANQRPHMFYGNGKKSFCARTTITDDQPFIKTGQCFNMTCEKGVLRVHIHNQSLVCNETNQALVFSGFGGVTYCPNPRHICFLINGKHYVPDPTPSASPAPVQTHEPTQKRESGDKNEQNDESGEANSKAAANNKKTAIISSVVVVIIVVAAVAAVVIFIRLRKKSSAIDDSGEGVIPSFEP